MKKNIYLTDEQYKEILYKIKTVVDDPAFKPSCYDSNVMGDKFTETNCGLCNDNFTTKDTALFPKDFPKRKTMKYRRDHHICPFDIRSASTYGCFYFCMVFSNRSVNDLRLTVDETIKRVEENIK